MFRKLISIAVFNLLALPSHASSILVLGDSLSAAYQIKPEQGWVSLLQDKLVSEGFSHQVINSSVSGDTTQNGIARLQKMLQQTDADVVVIELGGNDGLRGTHPLAIKRNLTHLVDMAQKSGAKVLLLGMQLPPNYGAVYTQKFAEIYPEVAQAKNIALVPFFMEGVALIPERMQDDGIHPNASGQPYLLDTVWPYLKQLLN